MTPRDAAPLEKPVVAPAGNLATAQEQRDARTAKRLRDSARAVIYRSNESIALRMTIAFGSIWCVYAFTIFSLVPLLLPKAQNTLLYVSNCIQLVALPALMVGSALLARSSEQRATQDHEALLEILADVREELTALKAFARLQEQDQRTPALRDPDHLRSPAA